MYNIYSVRDETTAPRIANAMIMGGFGHRIYKDDVYRAGGWAGFGSPQTWQSLTRAIRNGDEWIYADHAYFGRKHFYRVTRNAFQHSGIGKPDFDRLRAFHYEAAPFRKDGGHVLVCLHSDNFHERMGAPLPIYLDDIKARIRLYSDRRIIVRTKRDVVPFEKHLKNAWAVVTHSSACALHALMAGVPAFTTADSAIGSLTLRDPINIERPFYPDSDLRMTVAAVLAANQWTADEISRGLAWSHFNETV